jgi:hypothetical protein
MEVIDEGHLRWFGQAAPPPFWLEPVIVVDVFLAGWYSWTLWMSPKVGCSKPSAMVERI